MHIFHVIFSFSLIFSSFVFSEEPPPYTIIEDEAKLPLLTPDFANRKVLKIRLTNGLEAYLISDPKADKSAAALSVRAGSWDDPKENPGIAHFLEHMLFLGTKKYPDPSEYNNFITEHDGNTNAFTTSTFTSYMFSIDNQAFEEGLDRFSRFFIEPLFNPSGVSRELQIIDQEYAKNFDNDNVRSHFVWKELSNPEHPFHSFNIGNKETLSKASQTALQNWYHQHYNPKLMTLMVYSTLPIEKLKEIVVADFKDVKNGSAIPTEVTGQILPDSMHNKMVYIEPVKDIRTVTIMWELPEKFIKMKESKPESLICTLLGHEGEESLLAELKREKFAEALSCGIDRLGLNKKTLFIDVTLTDEGIKNVNSVIERSFQAIARFKEKVIPAYLFDETQRIATINYQYQPRQDAFDYVMGLASAVVDENIKTFPEQTLIVQKFDPVAVQELFKYLTPQNAFFYIVAPAQITGIETNKKEKWFGVPYTIKEIDPKILKQWENVTIHSQINLPAPNPFIPENLSLVASDKISQKQNSIIPHPDLLIDNEMEKIYFSSDKRFLTPEVFLSFEIKTPQIDMGNANKIVLADLYVESIKDALKRISYPASAAGLHYYIERKEFGVNVTIQGYNDNIALLFNEIAKQLKEIRPSEQQFLIYKDSLKRQYADITKRSALEQASELLKKAIYKKFTTDNQKASAISKITFSKFNEYVSELFDQTYIEGMIYGNITKQEAKSLAESLALNLNGAPFPKEQRKKPEVINLPEEQGPSYYEVASQAQGNAVILGIEYPTTYSFKAQAAQQILMQAIKEPFFTELRTKQQTGYIVFTQAREIERHLFNFFADQSNSHSPRDLLARFELFIETYLQDLQQDLTEQRFDTIRQTLVNTLKEPAKDIKEMGELLQRFAFKYDADFDWLDKRIEALKVLTYEEFLDFARKDLGKENQRRFAVLLKGITPPNVLNYSPIPNLMQLRKMSTFTNGSSGD